jgi:hypothetical protein
MRFAIYLRSRSWSDRNSEFAGLRDVHSWPAVHAVPYAGGPRGAPYVRRLPKPERTDGVAAAQSTLQALQPALGGHNELERELGRGGMATVYAADVRHCRLDRPDSSISRAPSRAVRR